ncbi:phospholipase C [Malassezia cuniculi]|uniref:Phospholipase C n=1 Tax=Malassezia cuniculi TaxID=948313 RepID=A0AAF0J654_9BASI|nr:phospholipase C [Malassezia cuniculi]
MKIVAALALAAVAGVYAAEQGLKKIEHVVLFMQENRAFDHYFGTMAGVRGFHDPNVHISNNTGKDVFNQIVDNTMLLGGPPAGVDYLRPWYLNHAGGDWRKRTQCMLAGTNAWRENHDAYNNGNLDQWAKKNTPYSIGYFKREDIPVQFTLADEFVVGDSYYESVIASTDPNRAVFFSGSINAPGSPVGGNGRAMGGPVLDNTETPGCHVNLPNGEPYSCRPFKWKTVGEYLQERNITWQVYQDEDNFGDDTLTQWQVYQDAPKDSELAVRGISYPGLDKFYADAAAGKLPAVSYIVAPMQLSEHPPFTPQDGAWLQRKVAEAVLNSPAYSKTALIVSYDETGGWADHVMAPHAAKGTAAEWMEDPMDAKYGMQPIGPGFRLPFYIVSPWTRRGGVFTEHSAHESQIMFLEEWATAHGKGFHVKEMNQWRRAQLSNLVKAFDFAHPDYSAPGIAQVPDASKDPLTHKYNGGYMCGLENLAIVQPPIPYGQANEEDGLYVESGYKRVRGDITEGRYLTLEQGGVALTASGRNLTTAAVDRSNKNGLFVVQWQGGAPSDARFRLANQEQTRYVSETLDLTTAASKAAVVTMRDVGNGAGYAVVNARTGKHLAVENGRVVWSSAGRTFEIYSVSV